MADECDGAVTRIYCRLCAKFADRLKSSSRNFSQQFVTGITGSSMKKDALDKHLKSDGHKRAETVEDRCQLISFSNKRLQVSSAVFVFEL
jgi:hypothetical protein